MEQEIAVQDSSFDKEVLEKSETTHVLVDFWASWCTPSTILKPVLEKIAAEMNGKFLLVESNVDENLNKARDYGVTSVPSVKLFVDGKIVNEFVGANVHQYKRFIRCRRCYYM